MALRTSTAQFRNEMRRYLKNVKGSADQRFREVVRLVLNTLTERSPVDTGRFRANWNTSVGTPNYSFGDRRRKIPTRIPRCKVGDTVYFTNATPYGKYLENGRSRQAPQGVVYPTIRDVTARIIAMTRSKK